MASAGVCDAFSVLAFRQGQDAGPAGCRKAGAGESETGRGERFRRPRSARARPGADAQAGLDHRSDGARRRAFDHRGQSGHPALQIRSAHPGRRARERLPAAERRAQRGAHRARCRGRDQPGAARAVARSRARDHQEEQARRAAGIRSGAAGPFAAEVAAGAVRDRPRSVLADAGRARARRLLRALHRLCGRQVARHRRRIPVARSGTCRARRQFDRRRLSGAAAECAAGAGQVGRPVAVGRDRQSAQEGRGGGIPRRGFSFEIEPVRRHQQHHAVQPADGRAEHPAQQCARAEVGCRDRRRG